MAKRPRRRATGGAKKVVRRLPLPKATTTTPAPPLATDRRQGHLAGGHYVYIFAVAHATQVTAQLAEAGGRLTGGYGKWEEVAIPRGQAFSQWTGRPLRTMDLELVLDGYGTQTPVETAIRAIEVMASPVGAGAEPAPVRIIGAVPHPELTWAITGLDWGDVIRDKATGQRLRAAITLHLMEYVAESVISALSSTTAAKKPAPRKYKVKRGDDLKKLAAKFLGKSSRWPVIVKANKGLRGWKLPSKWVGKTILIPPK